MNFLPTYHHLTHHIIPGPQSISYFIPFILIPTALLIPRSALSRWQSISIFIPSIFAAVAHASRAMGCMDVISVNVLTWSFYLLVLRDPWEDFTLVHSTGVSKPVKEGKESTESSGFSIGDKITTNGAVDSPPACHSTTHQPIHGLKYPSTLPSRIPWIGRLLVSIRLNNWKINMTSHDRNQPPPRAFTSRTAFAKQALMSYTRGILILALTSTWIVYDPYFMDLSVSISSPVPFSIIPSFIPPRTIRSAVIGGQAWALISQMFYLPCLLPVGLNALHLLEDEWSPHTWAPYFGSLESVFLHGVRGFWGQYWHQTMRHSCSAPGYAIADGLGLKRGGLMRYTNINMVTFGLSGIVHSGLVPPEPLHATTTANTIRLYFAAFFWVQPIAMLIETVTIRILNTTKLPQIKHASNLQKLANAIWITSWFSLCLPLLGEAGRQLGWWQPWHHHHLLLLPIRSMRS